MCDLIQAQFGHLQARWPAARQAHVCLAVGDPFLTGESQTLLRDGRIGEICYVLYRGTPARGVLLHIKDYYPAGGFRLPTGGILPGEDVAATLRREVQEETGLRVAAEPGGPDTACVEAFLGLLTYSFRHRQRAQTVPFATFVFIVQAPAGAEPVSQDATEQIAAWRWQDARQLHETAAVLDGLRHSQPYWADWGRFRAAVHAFVAAHWLPAHRLPALPHQERRSSGSGVS